MLQQEVSFCISPRVWTLGSNRTDITLDSLQEESWTTNRCPEIRIFTANLAALPEVQQLQRRQLLKKPDKNPFKNPDGEQFRMSGSSALFRTSCWISQIRGFHEKGHNQ